MGWHDVFDMNLQRLNQTLEAGQQYDLVLYGDSIIERMEGRIFGKVDPHLHDQSEITKSLLTKAGGGQINALPLGVAGDEVSTIYRSIRNTWLSLISSFFVIFYNCSIDNFITKQDTYIAVSLE